MPRPPLTLNRRPILFLLAALSQLANPFPLRIRWGEGRVRCFRLLLVILLLLLLSPFQSSAVTFTNAVTISETNNIHDGQDIVVDGATVTIDGPHSYNSVLLTNNAVVNQPARPGVGLAYFNRSQPGTFCHLPGKHPDTDRATQPSAQP